ncbi:uncharacterized protein LOC116337740 [Contarinia nasturtii]|uniref:uncharacterized protein LOC116337740 n=1 Tax=Contarinia nasturtii TaxID=265458 RepID=UPI0012D43243|nr:uncharacterized protein LOC116337740 [Contarinia nasturtii]
MSFFRIYWLRRLIRRYSTPIPYRKAINYREKLSVIYAFCSMNMLCYMVYQYSKGKLSKEEYGIEPTIMDQLPSSTQFAINLGVEKAKIYRKGKIENFNIEDYAYVKEEMAKKNIKDDADDEDNVA